MLPWRGNGRLGQLLPSIINGRTDGRGGPTQDGAGCIQDDDHGQLHQIHPLELRTGLDLECLPGLDDPVEEVKGAENSGKRKDDEPQGGDDSGWIIQHTVKGTGIDCNVVEPVDRFDGACQCDVQGGNQRNDEG